MDDEYRMLANNLVDSCPILEIYAMTKSTTIIKKKLVDEVTALDWSGYFIDCIVQGIDGRSSSYKDLMNYIAQFFVDNLDLDRLRKNLVLACHEKGYNITMKGKNV